MGPVTAAGALPLVDSEDVAWFRDRPDGARGAAAALGRRIGLGEQRTAELVLAVAELAANVTKHAVDGSVLLRVVRNEAVAGVELIVVDSGPGMADVPGALRDGVSTAGTLGIGLGAVGRLADTFDIHSQPGLGTVQLARFWPRPLPPSVTGEPLVAGITRPIGGEQVCGDAWAARTDTNTAPSSARAADNGADPAPDVRPNWSALTRTQPFGGKAASPQRPSTRPSITGRSSMPVRAAVAGPGQGYLVMSCDGLGHGPMASVAAQAAVHAFRTGGARTPEQAIEQMHRALRGTRGAAVAVARIEPDGRLLFCGVGNITAALATTGTRSTLLSHPGIVGHQMHQLRTYEHHLPTHGILVMHSDGLSERWRATDLAGLLHRPPALIATALLRLAGTRRDDASAVIARAAR
ncbi:ATP-binding SpoIIE family protein phosphatase [Streptomyces sp. NPDC058542]|uniref:ATP-binding SpoIIE family protein phosphatase n=1 Tax=Streptomyces sp. NPDC058542 TaxID=3346543 RepID=UPI00366780A4